MKKGIDMKRLSVCFALLASPALAHSGGHGTDFFGNLVHLLSQPDHLIIVGCGVAVVGVVAYLRKAPKP